MKDFEEHTSSPDVTAYDDRSPGEREDDEIFAEVSDPDKLVEKLVPQPKYLQDGSFVIDTRDSDHEPVEQTVTALTRTPNMCGYLARALAVRGSVVLRWSLMNEIGAVTRFVAFLGTRDLLEIRPRDITNKLLDDYKAWLDEYRTAAKVVRKKKIPTGIFPSEGGRKLGTDTKRSAMRLLLDLLRVVRVDRSGPFELRRDLDLVRPGDWKRNGSRRKPTHILTRPQLKSLVRICREEVVETTQRLRSAWAVMDGEATDTQRELLDVELIDEVRQLHERCDGQPPAHVRFKRTFSDELVFPFPRLRELKPAEYHAALGIIYPRGRLLVPFVILFAIYYRFNVSILERLKPSDFHEQPSPYGLRLVGQKFKNRAGRTQVASWPITADLHNPAEMLKTLARWTSSIRPQVGVGFENDVFLDRVSNGRVVSFAQRDFLRRPFKKFVLLHEQRIGGLFTMKMIRPSVINLVHHLFDGDLLATAQAGQHDVRTLVNHYLSDGARKRNEEALVPALHIMNSFIATNGLVDGREDKQRGDRAAVTPGFDCMDRYASPVPGQRPQTLCTAYGACPTCPLGSPRTSSPEAFALVVKLFAAIEGSRTRIPAETWLSRWAPVRDEIENVTLWQFPPEVRDAADLNIPDLPFVE